MKWKSTKSQKPQRSAGRATGSNGETEEVSRARPAQEILLCAMVAFSGRQGDLCQVSEREVKVNRPL